MLGKIGLGLLATGLIAAVGSLVIPQGLIASVFTNAGAGASGASSMLSTALSKAGSLAATGKNFATSTAGRFTAGFAGKIKSAMAP